MKACTPPLCSQPNHRIKQKIARLDVSHLSLCTWISFTASAKHTPHISQAHTQPQSALFTLAILQGKRRAPQSPQQSHQSDSNKSNLLSLGTATSVTWELFPCRCDPPGYKHCQDADHQYTIVGHIKNGGSLIKELIDNSFSDGNTEEQENLQTPTQISNHARFLPQSIQKTGRTETGHEKLELLKYLLLQPARIAPGFFTRVIAKNELVSLCQRQ